MAQAARHLRVVDENGELHDLKECPSCREWQRKYQGLILQLANLRADKDQEARAHELWPKAVDLFENWKDGTGKKRARWTADRFWKVEPFLRREGERDCRYALRGLLGSEYHMKQGRYKDREGARYDEFERPFKDQATFERFRDMAPQPSAATLAFCEWYDQLPGALNVAG